MVGILPIANTHYTSASATASSNALLSAAEGGLLSLPAVLVDGITASNRSVDILWQGHVEVGSAVPLDQHVHTLDHQSNGGVDGDGTSSCTSRHPATTSRPCNRSSGTASNSTGVNRCLCDTGGQDVMYKPYLATLTNEKLILSDLPDSDAHGCSYRLHNVSCKSKKLTQNKISRICNTTGVGSRLLNYSVTDDSNNSNANDSTYYSNSTSSRTRRTATPSNVSGGTVSATTQTATANRKSNNDSHNNVCHTGVTHDIDCGNSSTETRDTATANNNDHNVTSNWIDNHSATFCPTVHENDKKPEIPVRSNPPWSNDASAHARIWDKDTRNSDKYMSQYSMMQYSNLPAAVVSWSVDLWRYAVECRPTDCAAIAHVNRGTAERITDVQIDAGSSNTRSNGNNSRHTDISDSSVAPAAIAATADDSVLRQTETASHSHGEGSGNPRRRRVAAVVGYGGATCRAASALKSSLSSAQSPLPSPTMKTDDNTVVESRTNKERSDDDEDNVPSERHGSDGDVVDDGGRLLLFRCVESDLIQRMSSHWNSMARWLRKMKTPRQTQPTSGDTCFIKERYMEDVASNGARSASHSNAVQRQTRSRTTTGATGESLCTASTGHHSTAVHPETLRRRSSLRCTNEVDENGHVPVVAHTNRTCLRCKMCSNRTQYSRNNNRVSHDSSANVPQCVLGPYDYIIRIESKPVRNYVAFLIESTKERTRGHYNTRLAKLAASLYYFQSFIECTLVMKEHFSKRFSLDNGNRVPPCGLSPNSLTGNTTTVHGNALLCGNDEQRQKSRNHCCSGMCVTGNNTKSILKGCCEDNSSDYRSAIDNAKSTAASCTVPSTATAKHARTNTKCNLNDNQPTVAVEGSNRMNGVSTYTTTTTAVAATAGNTTAGRTITKHCGTDDIRDKVSFLSQSLAVQLRHLINVTFPKYDECFCAKRRITFVSRERRHRQIHEPYTGSYSTGINQTTPAVLDDGCSLQAAFRLMCQNCVRLCSSQFINAYYTNRKIDELFTKRNCTPTCGSVPSSGLRGGMVVNSSAALLSGVVGAAVILTPEGVDPDDDDNDDTAEDGDAAYRAGSSTASSGYSTGGGSSNYYRDQSRVSHSSVIINRGVITHSASRNSSGNNTPATARTSTLITSNSNNLRRELALRRRMRRSRDFAMVQKECLKHMKLRSTASNSFLCPSVRTLPFYSLLSAGPASLFMGHGLTELSESGKCDVPKLCVDNKGDGQAYVGTGACVRRDSAVSGDTVCTCNSGAVCRGGGVDCCCSGVVVGERRRYGDCRSFDIGYRNVLSMGMHSVAVRNFAYLRRLLVADTQSYCPNVVRWAVVAPQPRPQNRHPEQHINTATCSPFNSGSYSSASAVCSGSATATACTHIARTRSCVKCSSSAIADCLHCCSGINGHTYMQSNNGPVVVCAGRDDIGACRGRSCGSACVDELVQQHCCASGWSPNLMHTTPQLTFGKSDASVSDCIFCLSTYQANDIVARFPTCQHIFHFDCLNEWISYQHYQQNVASMAYLLHKWKSYHRNRNQNGSWWWTQKRSRPSTASPPEYIFHNPTADRSTATTTAFDQDVAPVLRTSGGVNREWLQDVQQFPTKLLKLHRRTLQQFKIKCPLCQREFSNF
eukprot:Lankesteria_metandrocarpae@DN1299_c0_g1_i1.p1